MGLLFICSLTENNNFALEIEVNHSLKQTLDKNAVSQDIDFLIIE